jgi:hypothetical protein
LLHVVDIKGWDAIAMLGRVVKQLPKGNASHGLFSVTDCGSAPKARASNHPGNSFTGHA